MIKLSDTLFEECGTLMQYIEREKIGPAGKTVELVKELIRFLSLKAVFYDTNARLLSPSRVIDEAWHALMLQPVLYVSICDRLLPRTVSSPRIIDHNPLGGTSSDRGKRYFRTLGRYLETFDEQPPAEFWPLEECESISVLGKRVRSTIHATVNVQLVFKCNDFVIQSTTVKMPRKKPFRDVVDVVMKSFGKDSKGVPYSADKFSFYGPDRTIRLDDTPDDHLLEDGDQIDISPRPIGC